MDQLVSMRQVVFEKSLIRKNISLLRVTFTICYQLHIAIEQSRDGLNGSTGMIALDTACTLVELWGEG
jgi:hypothetical protein